MTYEEFWEKDVEMVRAYREADRIRQKRKDYDMWLQGRYVYDALCCASPILHAFAKEGTQPHPYTEEPYPRTKKDLEEKQERIMKENAERFRAFVAMKNEERREKNGQRSHD